MRGLLITVLIAFAGVSGGTELPPQATVARVGGADCAVIHTVLDAYLNRARESGERWGFEGLRFYVLAATEQPREEISARVLFFDPENHKLLESLLARPVAASLLARMEPPASLLACELPDQFAFVHDPLEIQFDTIYDYLRYQVFPGFEGVLHVSLPGYSPDECQALVSVYAEFPIWEEQLVYHLVSDGAAWRVEKTFQVYLQGE